jgi:hypothetical protein
MVQSHLPADTRFATLGFHAVWHKALESHRLAPRRRLIKHLRAETRRHRATNNSTLPDLHRPLELVCLKLLEWDMRLQKDRVRRDISMHTKSNGAAQ